MLKKGIVLGFLLLLVSSVVYAEGSTWRNKQFNFSSVKTIMFFEPIVDNVQDPFALQKVNDLLKNQKLTLKLVSMREIVQKIGQEYNIDMDTLYTQDNKKFMSLIVEEVPKYVDVVLAVKVQQLGWSTEQDTPGVVPITTWSNIYFSNGRTAQASSTQYVPMGGGTTDYAHATLVMALFETKTQQLIWGYSDHKSGYKNFFNMDCSPDKYLKRILEEGIEKMPFPKR